MYTNSSMPVFALLIAYLLGAVPFGYLLVKWRTGSDVRRAGSGNIGATNVLRTHGRAIALLTLVLDIAKGYLALWIAARLTGGNVLWLSAAAVAVMAGHAYTLFLRFQGGKAVASFVGAFFYLTPAALTAVIVLFIGVVAFTRYISLGSVIAAGSFPLAVWMIEHPPLPVLIASLAAGLFIVYKHKANLARIRAGNENVLSFSGKKR